MQDGIGSRAKRREDPRFLTGSGAYIDDLIEVGMLYAAIVRSPHAYERVLAVDASAASGLTGFVRCISAADVGVMTPIPVRIGPDPSFAPHLQRPLATDVARFVGEPVAIVLADTPRGAEDAAELVPTSRSRPWSIRWLRILLAAHPQLLSEVLQIVHRVIATFLIKHAGFKRGLKRDEVHTGAVTLIQRFGSAANLNIHLHRLILVPTR